MADNVTTQTAAPATLPTTTTFSTDEIGGVQYPRTKVSLGADGSAADWQAGQQTMANSAPVAIASNQTAVPVSGTVAVSNLAATQPVSTTDGGNVTQGATTDAAVITDAAGTLSAKLRGLIVLMLSLIAKLPGSLGQKAKAASLAVVIASDQDALAVTGTFFQATQPVSGTVAVSNLPATQAVSAASLPLPTGAATEATLAAESAKLPATLGQKAMAASLAVVVASDQGAVPVSGTVTAIVSDGTNTVTVQTANADGTSNTQNNLTATARLMGYNGATWDRIRVANVQKDLATVTITTITTVWTPASGKKFRLMGGTISVSAAGSVLFEDNAGAAIVFRTPKLAADTPYTFVCNGGQGFLSAAANNVLKATLSVAGAVTGTLWGTEE